MAISLETINVGVENQATGSDSLYTAFTKTQNNFATLANTASPYNTFDSGNGIITEAHSGNGVVTITNSGVVSLVAGTGITTSSSNGNVTISVSGTVDGNLVAGVTNVNVESSTLVVSGSPIVSSGTITLDLETVAITPGEYIAPTLTVDDYGRITAIASTSSSGTVTSIDFTPGDGIEIEGGPITTAGTIVINNTGVTRLNAGPGIILSGHTGELTVSTDNPSNGTVTSVDVTSNTLTITGGPVTSTGTINIELPSNYPASSSAPSTSGSAGVAGQIAYDATHIYVCIAANSWIRANASTW